MVNTSLKMHDFCVDHACNFDRIPVLNNVIKPKIYFLFKTSGFHDTGLAFHDVLSIQPYLRGRISEMHFESFVCKSLCTW